MQKSVYVASRTRWAPLWRMMRQHGAPICSSWIDEAEEGQTESPAELWARVQREIEGCTLLVAYATPTDQTLTGALVEIGMALALGKPVVLVGNCGQWEKRCGFQEHPNVSRALTFVDAFAPVMDSLTHALTVAKPGSGT